MSAINKRSNRQSSTTGTVQKSIATKNDLSTDGFIRELIFKYREQGNVMFDKFILLPNLLVTLILLGIWKFTNF
jgi:hypothetical protein